MKGNPMSEQWQCRVAPSLGDLESTHNQIWGTSEYSDDTKPTVFFGLYGLPDFYALWRHKGKRAVLWAGSDIIHLKNGYWLDQEGKIKIPPKRLAQWINRYCENWCENDVEQKELAKLGIWSKVCPSFLGNVDDYEVSYKPSDRPKVYASVSGDDFGLYKWVEIDKLAQNYPDIEFHLYGNTKLWNSPHSNVIVHGRVPKEQMNEEVKQMQGGLRLLTFDGFSEVLAKSVLWGQWPISAIAYPHMLSLNQLVTLSNRKEPNLEGREFYRKVLNDYPWNSKA